MDKITVVCHKDHDKGYEDFQGKCLLCVVENFGREIGRLNKQVEELTGLYHLQSQRAMDYAGAFMRSETLVQPQQEPVAYYYEGSPGKRGVSLYKETEEWQPLYTAPVDAVNMTQDRVDETAKGEHEPVAWITDGGEGELWWYQSSKFDEEGNLIGPNPDDIPLYTAPPKKEWVGLTDEEIQAERHKLDLTAGWTYDHFARAIEAKLKEKNG